MVDEVEEGELVEPVLVLDAASGFDCLDDLDGLAVDLDGRVGREVRGD